MEDKKQKNTLAKMGSEEQIKRSHVVRQRNYKEMGRMTMKQKERYEWRKKLRKKLKYKSDNDLW